MPTPGTADDNDDQDTFQNCNELNSNYKRKTGRPTQIPIKSNYQEYVTKRFIRGELKNPKTTATVQLQYM